MDNEKKDEQGMVRPWRPQNEDREILKQQIREHIRNTNVSDNAVFIPANPSPSIDDDKLKRVAVYARVSTLSTEQVSSIENQTKYYIEKIEKTPNWELQEIYSDEGKSGTSKRKRKEFQRLLHDAKDGKIDLIICASVSRFARNISDCMDEVNELRTQNPTHPVGVYFETENIYTLDPNSYNSLSMHALLADWESANKSRRMILSYDQRICMGQYPVADLLGLRHTKDGQLVIVEEEAKTVRFIFLAYICGYSCEEIAKILTEKERPTLKGRTNWNAGMVRKIMQNERRWGDLNVRKTIVLDYKKGKTVKNDHIRDAAFVLGHHDAIVSPELAKAAHIIADCSYDHTGLSDILVIKNGALKGFVNISPAWAGIDNKSFIYICKSVYSNEEIENLYKEAPILSNEEYNKIVTMQLDDYQIPHGVFFINSNTPFITISIKNMKINKKVADRFKTHDYIEILYHPILKLLIIRSCDENAPNAIRTKNKNSNPVLSISSNAFCNAIYERMDWTTKYKFRFRGVTRDRGKDTIMIFYLDEPQIIVDNVTKELYKNSITDIHSVQYIPYHNSEIKTSDSVFTGTAYPSSWNEAWGISLSIRKRRNKLIDSITEEDIHTYGEIVENPLIGKIPTREEIETELDELLMSI